VTKCGPAKAIQRLKVGTFASVPWWRGMCARALQDTMPRQAERVAWVEQARLEAIVGSCPKSKQSLRSGMKCWIHFARDVLGLLEPFPPPLGALLAWSGMFRYNCLSVHSFVLLCVPCGSCAQTFQNYLGYARVGCMLAGAPDDVFRHEALKRAKARCPAVPIGPSCELDRCQVAVSKRMAYKRREKRFIRLSLLQQAMLVVEQAPEWQTTAMWMLAAYAFCLRHILGTCVGVVSPLSLAAHACRVPSECLPMVVCKGEPIHGPSQAHQSQLYVEENEVVLCLRSRKNRPWGSRLSRRCWCRCVRALATWVGGEAGVRLEQAVPLDVPCACFGQVLQDCVGEGVHAHWPGLHCTWCRSLPCGSTPFASISCTRALSSLRAFLVLLGTSGAVHFRTHDLRRGHTQARMGAASVGG